jgi:Fur family peroxide stress response transcriptional regulator
MPGISLATVYRTLRLLASKGGIRELHVGQGKARFDGNTSAHYHFLCDRCGCIIDLDEPVDSAVEARVAQDTGLMVTRHSMELSGLCLDCQSASPAGADLVSASALRR